MQSYPFRIALQIIFLTGTVYGSTGFSLWTPINRNAGNNFEASVLTFFEDITLCNITTPSMNVVQLKPIDESDDKFELLDSSNTLGCRVRVLDLDENDTGNWTLSALSAAGNVHTHVYTVDVTTPTTSPVPLEAETTTASYEEPSDGGDGDDEEYRGQYLNTLRIDSNLGETHKIQIQNIGLFQSQACFIITPEGKRYNLERQEVSGIEVIDDNGEDAACSVKITLKDEDQVGQWMLISRGRDLLLSETYERRLPFIIKVTAEVNAIPQMVTIIKNKNLIVRLANEIPDTQTCKLLGPDGSERKNYEIDQRFPNSCGFIVRIVDEADNGIWNIVYGNRITYMAPIQVTVLTKGTHNENQTFTWIRDKPVQQIFGPESAVYCKIIDPKDIVIFEGFGRCNITLPRATFEHEGTWKMFVGLEGRILTEESTFTVKITNEPPKAEVRTDRTANRPILTLSCSVSSPYPIRACKFRDPNGRILMANHGVGEDRFSFHGNGSSYESGVYKHDCGIQITDPILRDLGFWRCAIETTEETYFGFLMAFTEWLARDPEVAAGISRDPILTADRRLIETVEGDNVLMSCSVEAPIFYCYFRAPNGTVYTVGPGFSSTDMAEYAGAGLDAGECSIRFRTLNRGASGLWSCHVGFREPTPEQRDHISVLVRDVMVVDQMLNTISVYMKGRQLDYCRFVRSDGFGFTSDDVPYEYEIEKIWLKVGQCTLIMIHPTELDRQPWTVVARIAGSSQEITRTTNGAPVTLPPRPNTHSRLQTLWMVFLISGIIMIILGVTVGSKKSRDWTYTRAASIRQSFRQRFARKAAAEANVTNNNTARAA